MRGRETEGVFFEAGPKSKRMLKKTAHFETYSQTVVCFWVVVGVTGLEPATSRTPCVRASQLRHTPENAEIL